MTHAFDFPVTSETGRALTHIAHERLRQEQLKAEGRFPYTLADTGLTNAQRLSKITEEVGEVAREVQHLEGTVKDGQPSRVALRKELTQVAALCTAWIERLT